MSILSVNNICRLIGQPNCDYLSQFGPVAIPVALATIGTIGLGCTMCWHWKAIPTKPEVYPDSTKSVNLDRAKASGFNCFSEGCIHSILPSEKQLNRESFRVGPNSHFWSSRGIKASIYNLDVEKEYNRFGIEVLKLLETQKQVSSEETVQTFKNFTGSIKRAGVRLNDSLPIWGELAKQYLEIAQEALTTPTQLEEAEIFINELREKTVETTYEWFFLFCDRLTILMSDPKLRGIPTKQRGTDFDAYRMELENLKVNGEFCWLRHDSYLRACNEVGQPHTIERYSSSALCKRLFPRVVMMPFPFDLDCAAIVLSLPELGETDTEDENLWLVGFEKKREIADDVLYIPSRFFIHDLFHLCRFLSFIFFEDLFYIEETEALVKAVPQKWERLSLLALKKMKEVVRTHIGDEKLIYSFLAFFLFHEHAESLAYSLNRIVESDQSHENSLTAHLRKFEKNYLLKRFIDLLPRKLIVRGKSCCSSKSNPSINWGLMSEYAANFATLLSKDLESRKEITIKFKEFNSLLSNIVINCSEQSEFDFYSPSEGIKYSKFFDFLGMEDLAKAAQLKQMTNGIITAPIVHYTTFFFPINNVYK